MWPKPCYRIPTLCRGEAGRSTTGIFASDDIVEGAWVGVQGWVDETDRLLPASVKMDPTTGAVNKMECTADGDYVINTVSRNIWEAASSYGSCSPEYLGA